MFKSLIEKVSVISDDWIMLEEGLDNEGLFYQVWLNGHVLYDGSDLEVAKRIYSENELKVK